MLINCHFDAAKLASNTKKVNFACSKLQIIKPHNALFFHFEKLRNSLSSKVSEIEILLLLLFKKNRFFRFT